MKEKSEQILKHIEYFRCPLCHTGFNARDFSLLCENGHCFDIAKKRYVNFAPNQKHTKYDKDLFAMRRTVFTRGFYDHIIEEITRQVLILNKGSVVIDAGCGEGYYAERIKEQSQINESQLEVIAFDISKEAIQTASKNFCGASLFVSDIANIPVKSGVADCVLNIFTPANYSEFSRVLKPNGIIIKVVPGKNHFKQLRDIVKPEHADSYDNSDVLSLAGSKFDIREKTTVSKTYPVLSCDWRLLWGMSPIAFNIPYDEALLHQHGFDEITVEAVILSGTINQDLVN